MAFPNGISLRYLTDAQLSQISASDIQQLTSSQLSVLAHPGALQASTIAAITATQLSTQTADWWNAMGTPSANGWFITYLSPSAFAQVQNYVIQGWNAQTVA
ncbi:MAG TPA: hypothetical protein VGU64_14975, partial [Terriglobales bacterium]|nr:hypothetical protein [Terriglobales bacterium]